MRLPEAPILRRELVGLLRTRKAFWIVILMLVLSSLIPLLTWPSGSGGFRSGVETAWTFNVFFMTQLTIALFIIPAFTAGAIAGERERETYDALYSTLLRPSSIVLAKVLSSAGFVLIVIICSSPTVFVLYLLGGLGFASILKCYAVLVGAMVASSIISISSSMRSRRTAQAAVRGVFWVLFWNVGLIFLLYLSIGVWSALTSSRSGTPAGFWFLMLLMSAVSPYAPISYEIFQPSIPGQVKVQLFGSAVWAEPWHLYLILAAALSLGHFLLLLRRARTPEYSGTTRRERRLARKGAHARPVRRSAFTRVLISCGDAGAPFLGNPVFLKEIRSEFFSRVWFRRACFWLPLLVFAAIGVVPMRPPERATIIACTAFTLVALIVPAVAASSFPREIEHGNLDFLRGTSLTLREVLTGKFLASLYSCWGIIAAACWVVPAAIMLSSTGRNNWWGWSKSEKLELGPSIVCMGLISLAAGLVFVAAAAMLASTLAKRTLSALLLAYSLLFGVFLGWPILASLMLSRSDAVMIATNPYVAIVQATSLSSDTSHDRLHAFFIVHGIAILILWKLSHIFLEAKHARDV